eukprot:s2474_g1.t1
MSRLCAFRKDAKVWAPAMAAWAADVQLKANAVAPGAGYPVTLHTCRSASPTPAGRGGSVHVPGLPPGLPCVSGQPRAYAAPLRPIPVRSSSTPTAVPCNMRPPGPYGPAPAQPKAPVALPLHPSMPAAPAPLIRPPPPVAPAPLNAGVRTPPVPMPVWQPVPSGRTDVSVPPTATPATPAAKQSPTLTVLIRDFEMTANLPGDWGSDLSCCASLAEHILLVVSELAQGLRILVSLEPSGPSVPVPRTGREDPAWHQVYGNYQELLAEALQQSNADSVRGFFQQSSCATPGKITWRLGEVQGFLRLCFTAFGLPAPNCHPAVWYQLIREVTDDTAGSINEDQSLQLLRLLLRRLLSGSQAEKEVQPVQGLAASVANMSSKARGFGTSSGKAALSSSQFCERNWVDGIYLQQMLMLMMQLMMMLMLLLLMMMDEDDDGDGDEDDDEDEDDDDDEILLVFADPSCVSQETSPSQFFLALPWRGCWAMFSATAPLNLAQDRRIEERSILTWGANANRQCLSDDARVVPAPKHVSFLRPLRSLAAGWEGSLLIDADGSLWGGGSNRGQCLSEELSDEHVPLSRLDIAELDGVPFEAADMGRDHILAILEGGRAVISWGPSNEFGQIGHGLPYRSRVRPGVVHLGGVLVKQVACGEHHSLVLTAHGEVYSFGCNLHGALGSGRCGSQEQAERVLGNHLRSMPPTVLAPVVVPNLPGVARAIAAGGQHSAVILRRGRLFLAGDNRSGQLGQSRKDVDWTSTFFELPFQDYMLRVRTVSLGKKHTLILSYDGELYACGCNSEGQLGSKAAQPDTTQPVDVPVRLSLQLDEASPKDCMVVGLSSSHDHTVAMVVSIPEGTKREGQPKISSGRPQTSASTRGDMGPDAMQTQRANRAALFIKTMNTIHEDVLPAQNPLPSFEAITNRDLPRPSTGQAGRSSESLSSGCTSRVGRSPRGLSVVSKSKKTGTDEGMLAEEVVLLQPVVQPGVAASVGFASLSVAKLLSLIQSAQSSQSPAAIDDLRSSLSAAFASPSLLNASFCFPGLYKPRLDAGGLLNVFKGLIQSEALFAQVEMHIINAAFEGLSMWANDHDEAASLIHRDQLRGLAALLLSPVLAEPEKPQPYEVMSRIMRLVAWMPAEGRRELQEVLVEDCSEEEVLRGLVRRVRSHCDETVKRAHQMQRLSPEIWEGLMLLQLLWGTNEAIAQRLACSLRSSEWPEPDFGQSLSQTLSQLATRASSNYLGRFTLAPQLRAPVPAFEFHLQSLAEEKVPPELEFRLFVENACAGPITPSEVLELPLYAARTDYGFEYVLPSKMRSFMANRNLVPVSYTRKVLQVENHHAQVYLQHQVARRVAADLEVLPGHEIHIDPALLFFILKVHRDRILEDTTAALQKATPEDLRRQLKVVFEGEQGVDEGGLAREFFRLLSAHVFTVDGGLFDPLVAQNARVLWFNSASVRESTEFWLAGVILGLVVYNNMPGLDVRFPPVVFKKIKNEQLVLEDLRQVHPETYLSLRSLLSWEPEEDLMAEELLEL